MVAIGEVWAPSGSGDGRGALCRRRSKCTQIGATTSSTTRQHVKRVTLVTKIALHTSGDCDATQPVSAAADDGASVHMGDANGEVGADADGAIGVSVGAADGNQEEQSRVAPARKSSAGQPQQEKAVSAMEVTLLGMVAVKHV